MGPAAWAFSIGPGLFSWQCCGLLWCGPIIPWCGSAPGLETQHMAWIHGHLASTEGRPLEWRAAAAASCQKAVCFATEPAPMLSTPASTDRQQPVQVRTATTSRKLLVWRRSPAAQHLASAERRPPEWRTAAAAAASSCQKAVGFATNRRPMLSTPASTDRQQPVQVRTASSQQRKPYDP